ncbi:hypothetical protein ACSDR0_47255 [Streptosporangium sp. G11]|uniref:hypothetical protein n=1 Tax=Streptosporangium sp. G11 TaxID=3436926 RepID=UPI003EB7BE2B
MNEPSTGSFGKIRESGGSESVIQALGAINPSREPRNNAYVVRGVSSVLIFLAGLVALLSVPNGNEGFAPVAIVFAIIGIGGRIEAAVRLRP